MPGAGAEAVLEDDGGVRAAVRTLLRLDGVEVGQRRHRRLLAPHPGAGPQRGDGLLPVQGGWRTDADQVGLLLLEHAVEVGVRVRDSALRAHTPDRVGVDVDGGDDLDLALLGEPGERGEMGVARDGARTDEGGPDATAGEAARRAVRMPTRVRTRVPPRSGLVARGVVGGGGVVGRGRVVVVGCGHEGDQRSIGVTSDVGQRVLTPDDGGGKRFPCA